MDENQLIKEWTIEVVYTDDFGKERIPYRDINYVPRRRHVKTLLLQQKHPQALVRVLEREVPLSSIPVRLPGRGPWDASVDMSEIKHAP